jgi:glycerophosphoryl diester phosphodiesterase
MTTTTTIIAHRGASHDKPENTLAAIAEAWVQHADAVEVDVRQSRDGQAVLIHDADTARCGGRDQPVVEQTVDELQQLDLGDGQTIPMLVEAWRDAAHDRDWVLDIKCDASIIAVLRQAITQTGFPHERIIAISGDDAVLTGVRKAIPGCRTLVLSVLRASGDVDTLIDQAKRVGADGVDLAANEHLDQTTARRIIDAGLPLGVWTVNDAALTRHMRSIGATMITTDRPGLLRQWLRN